MTKIKSNVAISESGFIFNPLSGESYSVNPIGREIFNALKANKEYDDVRNEITEKYHVDKDTFERDFSDFISMLKQYELIEEENEEEA